MHSLASVLDLPQDAMYFALGDYLADRVDTVGLAGLRPIERTLWLVRGFHWAVRDGGLLGYMLLPNRPAASEVEQALRIVGAVDTANILHDAYTAYENDLAAFAEHPWLLDEVEDLPLLVCRYALAHRDALLTTGSVV